MQDRLNKPTVDYQEQIARGEDALARATRMIGNNSHTNAGPPSLQSGGCDGSTGSTRPASETGPSASSPATFTPKRVSSAPPPPKPVGGGSGWIQPRIQTAPSEPLEYPFHFPEVSHSRVRAEMLRADRDFAHEEQARTLTRDARRTLAIRWISRILAVFAREACDLARAGAPDWRLSQTEPRVSEVLRLLALQAEGSKFIGGNKPYLTDGQGYVPEEVHAEIARSSEWSEYQETLVSLMDQCAVSHPDITAGREQARETTADAERELPRQPSGTSLGRNLDRLRLESGWSFDDMARATEIDKKLIMGHVNKGKNAYPRTLATYARIFTKQLGRPVTVAELES